MSGIQGHPWATRDPVLEPPSQQKQTGGRKALQTQKRRVAGKGRGVRGGDGLRARPDRE